MTKWKVLVNSELQTFSSDKQTEIEQFSDIKKKINKKMGVTKKTYNRPSIYFINKF